MIGERAITLTELGRTSFIGLTNANKREALRLYEHYIAALESPWHETMQLQQNFSDEFAARSKGLTRLRSILVGLLIPATDQYTISAARCAARQRTSILLIAGQSIGQNRNET